MPKLWSINALADELVLDRRTLTKRLADCPHEGDGRTRTYRLAQVVDHLIGLVTAEMTGTSSDGEDEDDELRVEIIRKTRAQADRAELEVEKLQGRLLEAAAVETAWTRVLSGVRARILSVPSSTAAELAMIEDPSVAQDLLTTALHSALAELALADIEIDDIEPEPDTDTDTDSPTTESEAEPAGAEPPGKKSGRRARPAAPADGERMG